MKRKLAVIQLVLIIVFGVLIFISIQNRKTVFNDWKKVTEEDYGLEVIEVYTESSFEINHYGEWDQLGFDVTVFERFHEAPLDVYPNVLVNVSYVLTNQGERLIYSYPYIYQRQDPSDFVHIVSDVIPKTKDQMKSLTSGNEDLLGFQYMLDNNEFVMVPPNLSFLNSFAGLASIIDDNMQDVMFFESFDGLMCFFINEDQLYIVRYLGGTDLFELYPRYTNLAGLIEDLDE